MFDCATEEAAKQLMREVMAENHPRLPFTITKVEQVDPPPAQSDDPLQWNPPVPPRKPRSSRSNENAGVSFAPRRPNGPLRK